MQVPSQGQTTSADTTASAILVSAWVVSDGHQEEFMETIERLFEHIRTVAGFIEGELLQSANPTRFVSYARMRSAADSQRLFEDSEVSARLRAAGRIARADFHSYHVVRAFDPPAT